MSCVVFMSFFEINFLTILSCPNVCDDFNPLTNIDHKYFNNLSYSNCYVFVFTEIVIFYQYLKKIGQNDDV